MTPRSTAWTRSSPRTGRAATDPWFRSGSGASAPGPHDEWGPGTRIPALVVSPFLHGNFVIDHTQYDTTSILATIERRFGLAPLSTRDAAVNDLSSVFEATPFNNG